MPYYLSLLHACGILLSTNVFTTLLSRRVKSQGLCLFCLYKHMSIPAAGDSHLHGIPRPSSNCHYHRRFLSLFRPRAPAPSTAATYRYVHKHSWLQLTQHAGCTGTLTTTTAYILLPSWYNNIMSALVDKLEKKKWRKEQFGLPLAIMTGWL